MSNQSSNQWTPINAPANPSTPQTIASSTPSSSTRRSTRVQNQVSYPKTPLRNKPKRRTKKSPKSDRTPPSSTRRSTPVNTLASYPKTSIWTKPKRRTNKSPKSDKSGGSSPKSVDSSPKSADSVTKIGRKVMDDLIRALGPDSDGEVPMSEKSFDSQETEEADWFGMGAAALRHGSTVPETDVDVLMGDDGLSGDETEEQDWASMGAAALRHGFTVLAENAPQPPKPVARTEKSKARPSRPQTYSCRECDQPDNDSMVRCDDRVAHQITGEAWFHLACVGLKPDTVPGEIWYCPPCEYEKIEGAFS